MRTIEEIRTRANELGDDKDQARRDLDGIAEICERLDRINRNLTRIIELHETPAGDDA